MEAEVRFFTSFDGTRLAYAEVGAGPPMVVMPVWNVWIELAGAGLFYAPGAFARRQRTVMTDLRGVGASEGEAASITLDALVSDLGALADTVRLDTFDLFAAVATSPVAVAFAAGHPERVRRLVLEAPAGSGAEIGPPDTAHATAEFIRGNWHLAAQTIAGLTVPLSARENQREYGRRLCRAVPAPVAARYVEFGYEFDVRDLLPRVKCPTLILQYTDRSLIPPAATRAVAARIPDARLLAMSYMGGYPEQVFEFLGHPLPAEDAGPEAPALPSGTAVILFADIVDSTALTEHLGDSAFREKARRLDAALRAVIRENGGTPVEGKLLGDGVLAVFASARQGIEAALACGKAGDEAGLLLHIGIHAGDVIRERDNVFGGAVNIAARIAAVSAPGAVLVSDTVRSLARTSAGVSFDDRGERELKGVGDPVRLFEVCWRR